MSDSECAGAPQLKVSPKSNRCIDLVLRCNELLCPLTVLVLDLTGEVLWSLVCFLLGNGCLFAWNSMLTIEDYYAYLFPVCSSFTITVYMIFIIYAQFQVRTG